MISILFTSARIPLAIILGGALLGLEGIWWAFSVTSIVKGIDLCMYILLDHERQRYGKNDGNSIRNNRNYCR